MTEQKVIVTCTRYFDIKITFYVYLCIYIINMKLILQKLISQLPAMRSEICKCMCLYIWLRAMPVEVISTLKHSNFMSHNTKTTVVREFFGGEKPVPLITYYQSIQKLYVVYTLKKVSGLAVDPTVRRRPFTADIRVRSRASPCGMGDEQIDTETDFSLSTSDFPCHHYTDAQYSFIHVLIKLHILNNKEFLVLFRLFLNYRWRPLDLWIHLEILRDT
jgi:hypothetical protein